MKEKEWKHLKRQELLELLVIQNQRLDQLQRQLDSSSADKEYKLPDSSYLEHELKKERYRRRYVSVLLSTIYSLITVAAAAVLIATLWLPVLQIYGTSMAPTLMDSSIVIALKRGTFQSGDIIAFYYNNKILVKRVIAGPGDWVDITEDGDVYVNEELLAEPYLHEKAFGDCNLELPYQVPESRYFVMGDHRSVSIDSRNTAVGCVAEEQVVGRLICTVWPFDRIAVIK